MLPLRTLETITPSLTLSITLSITVSTPEGDKRMELRENVVNGPVWLNAFRFLRCDLFYPMLFCEMRLQGPSFPFGQKTALGSCVCAVIISSRALPLSWHYLMYNHPQRPVPPNSLMI
jgi:hypothetical protein